jgi:hypothetical protein
MPIRIVFETHSTTEDNENGVATGWLPGRLSKVGREQAAELGRRRADDGIAAVFSSDLARATQTAAIAFAGTGIPVLLDWRLRECDYGELNGSSARDLEWHRPEHVDQPYPGGESWQQAARTRQSSEAAKVRRSADDGRRAGRLANGSPSSASSGHHRAASSRRRTARNRGRPDGATEQSRNGPTAIPAAPPRRKTSAAVQPTRNVPTPNRLGRQRRGGRTSACSTTPAPADAS